MTKRWLAALLALALCATGTALADWSEPDANLAHYEALYAEASEEYKLLKYGDEGASVAKIKETLTALGYYTTRVSNNYYRTLEVAVRVLATQLRIGGDGREISPLLQAMIADTAKLPRAISPVIDVSQYSWEEGSAFVPYTYTRITRSSVQKDAPVGFSGIITDATSKGNTYYYIVEMENDPEKRVYVTYQPLPQTTVFQPGDEVTVFGVTQGTQANAGEGAETPTLLVIKADRVGYVAK